MTPTTILLRDIRKGYEVLERLLVDMPQGCGTLESLKEVATLLSEFATIDPDAYEPEELNMLIVNMNMEEMPTAIPEWLVLLCTVSDQISNDDTSTLQNAYNAIRHLPAAAAYMLDNLGPVVSTSYEEEWERDDSVCSF
jgi:hypothetical protein